MKESLMLESLWKWNLNSDSQQKMEVKARKVQRQNLGRNRLLKKKMSWGESLREQTKLQVWKLNWGRIRKIIMI